MTKPDPERGLAGTFAPLIERLREFQRRFRPGHPYIEKPARATKRPHAMRKAERRRRNRAARIARRHNRRRK